MQDMVIKGTGNSRFLKSVENFLDLFPNYEAFATAFASGVLPVDFNGINPDGITQIGTPYAKSAVLTDATAALFGLDETAVPDDVLKKTGHVVFGSYEGTGAYGEDNPNTLAFSFAPKLIMFFDAYGAFMPVAGGYTVTPTNGLAFSPQIFGTEYSAGPPLFVTNTGNHTMSKRSEDGKTISWYTDANSAVAQYNNVGTTYHYIAIG